MELEQTCREDPGEETHLSLGGNMIHQMHVGGETAALPERVVLGCSPRHVTGECTMGEPAVGLVPWVQIPQAG